AIEAAMPSDRMTVGERRALLERGLNEIARVPGIVSASGVSQRPLQGPIGSDSLYALEGQTAAAAAMNPYVNLETVTPSYFQTMQTRLVEGRTFSDDDRDGTLPVVVVSQRFAERAWPGQRAIGKRLRVNALDGSVRVDSAGARRWRTGVWVVGDIRYRSLDSPGLTVYAAVAQSPGAAGEFVVRTSRADAIVISTIRDRLKTVSVDSVVKIESMDDVVGSIEAPWRANL